jgi:ABC-2 type transport system permease protein
MAEPVVEVERLRRVFAGRPRRSEPVVALDALLSQSARLGVDDFRSVYTWRSWLAGWLLRMLAQVAFFGSIGLLVGSRAEIGYLLVGNAVVLVCLEATIVVISVSVERFQGTLPLFAASPASPMLVYLGRGLHWMGTGLATSVVTLTLLPPLFGLPLSPPRVAACLPVLVVIAVSSYCYGSFLASLVARFPQFNWLALNVGYLAVMTVAGVNVPVDFWPGPVQAVANLLPVTHGLLAVRRLLDGGGLAAAAPQVGAELLVGAGWLVASWLSYRRFFRRSRVTGSFDVG